VWGRKLSSSGKGARWPLLNKDPSLAGVFTCSTAGSPSIDADIDRVKDGEGRPLTTDVFSTLQVYRVTYVNDFITWAGRMKLSSG